MCGRFTLYSDLKRLKAFFTLAELTANIRPRWNIAPSQMAAVVVTDAAGSGRRLELVKWGLIPSWVKDPAAIQHPINAKVETAGEKPMFRHAFRKGRVLVPADGFYEWKVVDGQKRPLYIRRADEQPLAFGGLLEHWHGPDGVVTSFTILTAEPNAMMRNIHSRMPVIIQPEDFDRWLDPTVTDPEQVRQLVRPLPDDLLEAYEVSRQVNSPANEGPDLVVPA